MSGKPSKQGERGAAMIMALLVMVLLVGLGAGLLMVGQNELHMSRSSNDERAAFNLAEAGVEAARMSLFASNGNGSFDDDLTTAAGSDSNLSLEPASLRAQFAADGSLSSLSGAGDDVALIPVTALGSIDASGGFYAAFLTNDPVDGASTVDSNERVMITSIGIAENQAVEVVQAIIEPNYPLPAVPTAAMTMLGPPPVFDNGSSNAQNHSGEDCLGSGGVPGLHVPIVGTTDPAADASVEGDMQRPANFTSGALSGADTVADLTDPTEPSMSQSSLPPIDPNWLDCGYIKNMVETLIFEADYYCDQDLMGSCTLPAGSPTDIMVVDGDVTAGSFDAGLLLVTGELQYDGNDNWKGIVLVLGEGRIHRNGGGNGVNTGAVVLANIDPSPGGARADKSDWCSSGFGQTSFVVTGNGSSTIAYCSDDINNTNPVDSYDVTEFLQR